MRKFRFTIGWLMILVLVLAIGLAALRSGTETWAGAMFLLTCGVLGLAVIGAIRCRGAEGAWWLGFALFGWGYMALAFWFSEYLPKLPTLTLLEVLHAKLIAKPPFKGFGPAMMGAFGGSSWTSPIGRSAAQICHCFWALLFATIGGLLARAFFGNADGRSREPESDAGATSATLPKWWLRPTVIALVASILIASIAATWSKSASVLWAGATFFLTCGLLGLLILGALFGRGRRREICVGAALFGMGYMLRAFGQLSSDRPRPRLATDLFLNAIRSRFPPEPRSVIEANARIQEALDQRFSMSFPNETPLDDVLKYVKQATMNPTFSGIPIYVAPLGLQEAERSLNSTVSMDLEGVPLRTTLAICLKQLGLVFSVQHGYLRISNQDEYSSNLEDPFVIVGHCLLALVAAGLGGVLAPVVSDARRERSLSR